MGVSASKIASEVTTSTDKLYPRKSNVYTKTDADARFPYRTDVYNRSEADAKFVNYAFAKAPGDVALTLGEANALFAKVGQSSPDSISRTELTTNYALKTELPKWTDMDTKYAYKTDTYKKQEVDDFLTEFSKALLQA